MGHLEAQTMPKRRCVASRTSDINFREMPIQICSHLPVSNHLADASLVSSAWISYNLRIVDSFQLPGFMFRCCQSSCQANKLWELRQNLLTEWSNKQRLAKLLETKTDEFRMNRNKASLLARDLLL